VPLSVTVTVPDFPDDYEFGVNGMGVFTNGQARELSQDEEMGYYNEYGQSVKNGTADTPSIKVSGTALVKDADLPELPQFTPTETEIPPQEAPPASTDNTGSSDVAGTPSTAETPEGGDT